MHRKRVGEERGSKEMDGCPLTVTQIAVLNVEADVAGHLWPPRIAGYQLKGLKAACMSGNMCIVVLFDNTTPKVSVIGDIDLTAEHE
jgi:hypothetical protein